MGLETGTYISDFVATNPTITDKRRKGDDHFRWMKSAILATFPNITGALTPTHTELNYVEGVTSAIQTQLDAKLTESGVDGDGLVIATSILAVGAGLGIGVNADDVQVDISGLAAIEGNALTPDEDGWLLDDNGVPKRVGFTDDGLVIQTVAGVLDTLVAANMNTYREYTNGAAISVVLNTGVGKKGNVLILEQAGAGQVTVSGTATLNNAKGLKTAEQRSQITLVCTAANTWTVGGDATP